jgi:hypothetical protein
VRNKREREKVVQWLGGDGDNHGAHASCVRKEKYDKGSGVPLRWRRWTGCKVGGWATVRAGA